jgi:hypothetical protein
MNEYFLTAYKIKSIVLVHAQRVFIFLACLFKEGFLQLIVSDFIEARRNFVLDSLHKKPHYQRSYKK